MLDTETSELFIGTLEEALKEAVKAMGGAKAVGSILKPQKLIDEAGTWLSDCLNPKRRDKLDYEQIMWILREARKRQFHGAINFICGDAGYANPVPIEPEDEKARLMREFIEATKQQTKNVEEMKRLSEFNLRSVG